MAESFTHGDTADLKFSGNCILAKLLAFPQLAAENFIPEALDDSGRQRLTPDGI